MPRVPHWTGLLLAECTLEADTGAEGTEVESDARDGFVQEGNTTRFLSAHAFAMVPATCSQSSRMSTSSSRDSLSCGTGSDSLLFREPMLFSGSSLARSMMLLMVSIKLFPDASADATISNWFSLNGSSGLA